MKVVIQRVNSSSVLVEGKVVGSIEKGMCILVGFSVTDTFKDIEKLVKKIVKLRIFDDEEGIMNKSISDIDGSILSISQFTLYANTKGGNRPSYTNSMNKSEAIILYDMFNKLLKEHNIKVKTGIFGAEMELLINNDGPVTIIFDSEV